MDHSKAHDVRTTHTDNIVFNCRFENKDRTKAVPLDYSSNRNGEILKANGMYYCSVDSFRIPNKALPIFKFDNSDGDYSVTLVEEGGTTRTAQLQFVNRGDLLNPGNTTSGNIYYIQQFLDMVNNAFEEAALTGTPLLAPLMTIDRSSDGNKFRLIIPAEAGGDVIAENGISMSYKLYLLFDGFNAIFNGYTTPQAFTFVHEEQDAADDIILYQEHHSIYNWTDIEQVIIFTSDLPIEPENFSNREETGNDLKFKVLASFTPFSREDGNIDKTDFTYKTEYPKLIDLKSTIGLQNISFRVGLLRKDGSLGVLYALPCSISVLKLRFVKRALFNNEYNLTGLNERIKHHALENYHHP